MPKLKRKSKNSRIGKSAISRKQPLLFSSKQWESSSLGRATRRSVILAQVGVDNVILVRPQAWAYEEHPPVGIRLHSYRNCPLDVWRFSPTRSILFIIGLVGLVIAWVIR